MIFTKGNFDSNFLYHNSYRWKMRI